MNIRESVQNVNAILINFEAQTGRKADLMKIHSSTERLEDFQAIKDFIKLNRIEVGIDDTLPVNQFVFLNKQSETCRFPKIA